MPTEQPPDQTTATIVTGGLGLVGSVLSLIFGGQDLTPLQRVGCVLAGTFSAVAFGPLVTLGWADCPHQVLTASGFIFGLGGLFVIRAIITWWRMIEVRLPAMFNRRLNIPDSPVTPAIPPVTVDPKPAGEPAKDQTQK